MCMCCCCCTMSQAPDDVAKDREAAKLDTSVGRWHASWLLVPQKVDDAQATTVLAGMCTPPCRCGPTCCQTSHLACHKHRQPGMEG